MRNAPQKGDVARWRCAEYVYHFRFIVQHCSSDEDLLLSTMRFVPSGI